MSNMKSLKTVGLALVMGAILWFLFGTLVKVALGVAAIVGVCYLFGIPLIFKTKNPALDAEVAVAKSWLTSLLARITKHE